jgi:methylmalonyl-CoA mutase cobalamin-binding domain/chain
VPTVRSYAAGASPTRPPRTRASTRLAPRSRSAVLSELEEAGASVPVVVGGIIPPADEAALREAGVARVYTPKDFEVSRIMGDIVDVVAEHHGVAAVS